MSAKLNATNTLRVTRIASVKTENQTTKTYTFKDARCAKAKPGQFLMLWIPQIDEIPLSIMNTEGNSVSVTVKAVGDATRHLHNMKQGETIGVRGPFGNHFTQNNGNVLLVGGGTGTAPLLFLAKQLATKTKRLSFIIGAKTKNELLFLNQLDPLCTEQPVAATEDGTYGLKCLATQPLETLLAEEGKEKFKMVYACGPEAMTRQVFNLTEKHGVQMEASLERLMRCGIGLCGSCMIGKYRVCKDGPVFNSQQLREVKDELGISKLGFDGNRIPL
ncbi:dihydroorotate dehydrogenase electron transfer subunit [Candidatus Bathyarchaeota archaeon]|nr:dihydroorotate dehydrogenase electron transfer subunit [Candidatus Bathyarchaeota archaeon]